MKRAIVTMVLCGALVAQRQEETPVFKASANLVIVTVSVKGKDGRPVKGLQKTDFTVTENGKAQVVSVFDFQELEETPRVATASLEGAAAAPVAAAPPAGSTRYRDRRLLTLFFDWTSLQPAEQVRAKDAAEKFLKEQMSPVDRVQVVSFGSRLKVDQEFTSDKEALLALIKKYQAGEMSELAGEGNTDTESDDSSAYAADETEFNIFNTDRKLGALEDMAKKLAALPEKKAVVYFSSGISRTGDDNQAQLRATVNAAVRANVSFYPIDVRGLQAEPPGGAASGGGGSGRGTGMFSGQTQNRQRQSKLSSEDTLVMLAEDTGGKALLDNNELTLGIQQAQEDMQSYYILGYYSNDERKDGQFRRVDVKLAPETGKRLQAKLEFRRGYFAQKEWKSFDSSDKEKQLQDALLLGDPVTDLRLALEVNWFRMNRERYFIPVAVKIPGSAIPLKKQGSAETTTFDFIGQVKDSKGIQLAAVRDSIKIQLREEKAGQLASRNLIYDTGFTLSPGKYSIKMLVRENQTGKMGTFETGFTIPELGDVKNKARLSTVVWSSQRTPVTEAVGVADKKAAKKQESHPLVRDKQKLLPSVTHVFHAGQTLYVYAEVYDPAAPEEQSRPAVAAAVTVYRDKKMVLQSAPVQVSALKEGRNQTAGVYLEIPLKELPAGEYTAQLNVVDQVGQKFAISRAPLVMVAR
ncbi:MAG: VWA domain-containing protein [Acidobacteria bacterium]|nr:VWA domain-containing protein [Acidobacteriota bacterium]